MGPRLCILTWIGVALPPHSAAALAVAFDALMTVVDPVQKAAIQFVVVVVVVAAAAVVVVDDVQLAAVVVQLAAAVVVVVVEIAEIADIVARAQPVQSN